jgi:ketopantoate reductase
VSAREDRYDYVFVVMQRTQVGAVLPVLAENRSPNIVFVVNTAAGYDAWAEAGNQNDSAQAEFFQASDGPACRRIQGIYEYEAG